MLSSKLVLPERYGPHNATTRCAPLPGLPPVMVSDLMSFMTTSSFCAVICARKLRTVVATDLGRSEALSWKSFHPGWGESIHRRGRIFYGSGKRATGSLNAATGLFQQVRRSGVGDPKGWALAERRALDDRQALRLE